jgi:Tfp pilus assembly protein PilF
LKRAAGGRISVTASRRVLASSELAGLFETAAACHRKGQYDAAERGFLDVVELAPNYENALNSLGLLYLDMYRYDRAEEVFWQASWRFPTDVNVINNLGLTFYRQGRLAEAKAKFEEALRLKPRYDLALANLGCVLRDWNQQEAAEEKFKKALAINPRNTYALINYGLVLEAQGQHDKAEKKYNRVLSVNPNDSCALNNKGNSKLVAGNLEEGLHYINKALEISPRFTQALWNKAHTLLALGRYREGFELYECGKGVEGLRGVQPFAAFTSPSWNGAVLADKTLAVLSEQGLGDSLQFVRYAALCKERVGKVIVKCRRPLIRLFKNSPFIDEVCEDSEPCDPDEHIAMMSLPHVFGTTLETVPDKVPYLFVDAQTAQNGRAGCPVAPGSRSGWYGAGIF